VLGILPSVREKRTSSLSRVLLPYTAGCLESPEPSEALKLMRSDQLKTRKVGFSAALKLIGKTQDKAGREAVPSSVIAK